MAEKKVVHYKLIRHKWPDEIKAQKEHRMKVAVVIAVCVLCFFSGLFLNNVFHKSNVGNDTTFNKLSEIYTIMSDKFYFGKDQKAFNEKLVAGAIDGMVGAGGDQHTTYLAPSDSQNFTTSMEGTIEGIGINFVQMDGSDFLVTRVLYDSPAKKAGILKGDQIYKINDTISKGKDAEAVRELIAKADSPLIKVEVIRDGKHLKMEAKREVINSSVYTEINGKTAVMEISSFAETTGDEAGKQFKDIKKAGCTSLVIDLRNNGGGYLQASQQVASYLMGEDQIIFKEVDKDGKTTEYKTLKGYEHYSFKKVIVLINGGTASASEVLTGALKEQVKAEIVGEKSYGKGTIQVPLTFKDGSMLKYTIGEWLTPKGNKINKVGISPDVEVIQEAVYTMGAPKLDKNDSFKPDSVNVAAKSVQTYLQFLGYKVDRVDEYFSPTSGFALKEYQKDKGLKVTGNINSEVVSALMNDVTKKWNNNPSVYDMQMKKATELANGK